MKRLWQELPTGVRGLIAIAIALWICTLVPVANELLRTNLGINGAALKSLKLWTLFTHALIPGGIGELISSAIILAMIGSNLRHAWSATEFWSYCAITAAGGGLIEVLFQQGAVLIGMGCITSGLLAAWIKLCGNETVQLLGGLTFKVWQAAVLFLAISLVMTITQGGGLMTAISGLAGALVGWIYLTIRWKTNLAADSRKITSDRIRNLEL